MVSIQWAQQHRSNATGPPVSTVARLDAAGVPNAPCRELKSPLSERIKHIRAMRKSREIIGYVRDALVILIIVAAGMYVLNYPEKVDAFLNWMLRRH